MVGLPPLPSIAGLNNSDLARACIALRVRRAARSGRVPCWPFGEERGGVGDCTGTSRRAHSESELGEAQGARDGACLLLLAALVDCRRRAEGSERLNGRDCTIDAFPWAQWTTNNFSFD